MVQSDEYTCSQLVIIVVRQNLRHHPKSMPWLMMTVGVVFCVDSLSARSAAELYTGSVCCTWNTYGHRASCVITAGHAML